VTVELTWIEVALRIGGVISSLIAGGLAVLYFRERGGQVAQERLNQLNADIISTYETRVRLLQVQIEGLTRELQIAQQTLAEMRRREELIG
jgi:hypothetical protein